MSAGLSMCSLPDRITVAAQRVIALAVGADDAVEALVLQLADWVVAWPRLLLSAVQIAARDDCGGGEFQRESNAGRASCLRVCVLYVSDRRLPMGKGGALPCSSTLLSHLLYGLFGWEKCLPVGNFWYTLMKIFSQRVFPLCSRKRTVCLRRGGGWAPNKLTRKPSSAPLAIVCVCAYVCDYRTRWRSTNNAGECEDFLGI